MPKGNLSRHVYRRLESSEHFRVLRVFPRCMNEMLLKQYNINGVVSMYCTLSHCAISERPPYTCLSYTWGTDDLECMIVVDGYTMKITANAELALFSQQHETAEVSVWIDSVCINQNDIHEREQQVQLMYNIYAGAESVVAYLGEEADGSQQIPELFRKVLVAFFSPTEECFTPEQFMSCVSDDAALTPTQFVERCFALGFPKPGDDAGLCVLKFISRPWFTRVWVIQEAVAARKLVFVCGSWTMPAEVLFYAVAICAGYGVSLLWSRRIDPLSETRLTLGERSLDQLRLMANLNACSAVSTSEGSPGGPPRMWSLVNVLERARRSSSTDPKDKIFALLNLCQDKYELDISPDYDANTSETYKLATRALIKHGFGDRVLMNCGNSNSKLNLPSWIPDWSVEPSLQVSLVPPSTAYLPEDPLSIETRCYGIRNSDNEEQIIASAIVLDRVVDMEPVCIREEILGDSHETYEQPPTEVVLRLKDKQSQEQFNLAKAALRAFQESQMYPKHNAMEATWRTLLCRHSRSVSGWSENSSRDFEKFLLFGGPVNAEKPWRQAPHLLREFLGAKSRQQFVADAISRATTWQYQMAEYCYALRLARTKNGYIGMVPLDTESGHIVVCIKGVHAPFVLRVIDEDQKHYEIVGPAFFHGFMGGEIRLADLEAREAYEDVTLV